MLGLRTQWCGTELRLCTVRFDEPICTRGRIRIDLLSDLSKLVDEIDTGVLRAANDLIRHFDEVGHVELEWDEFRWQIPSSTSDDRTFSMARLIRDRVQAPDIQLPTHRPAPQLQPA